MRPRLRDLPHQRRPGFTQHAVDVSQIFSQSVSQSFRISLGFIAPLWGDFITVIGMAATT